MHGSAWELFDRVAADYDEVVPWDLPDDRRAEFHERVLALQAKDLVLRRTSGVWSGRKTGIGES